MTRDGQRSGGLSVDWEQKMRALLCDADTRQALESIQLSLPDSATRLAALMQEMAAQSAPIPASASLAGPATTGSSTSTVLSGSKRGADGQLVCVTAGMTTSGGERVADDDMVAVQQQRVRYIGVAVSDNEQLLRDQLQALWSQLGPMSATSLAAVAQKLQQQEQQQEQPQEQHSPVGSLLECSSLKVQSKLHVTLWHEGSMPEQELQQDATRRALLAAVGDDVHMQLCAFDVGRRVIAAQVRPAACTAHPPDLHNQQPSLTVCHGAATTSLAVRSGWGRA